MDSSGNEKNADNAGSAGSAGTGPASASISAQLAVATLTPIAQLGPDLADPNQDGRAVRGEVALVWPYNSVRHALAFLLAEPDVRLRRARGQIRVELHGPSAAAVAASGLGGGDEVLLSLSGARWSRDAEDSATPTRGARAEWQLAFDSKIRLVANVGEAQDPHEIAVDENEQQQQQAQQPAGAEETPQEADKRNGLNGQAERPDEAGAGSSLLPRPVSPPQLPRHAQLAGDEYASPAFIKRARISFGSLFEPGFDIFEEDGGVRGRGRKRTRFGRPSNAWRYSSQSVSPERQETGEDEVAEGESGVNDKAPEKTTGDAAGRPAVTFQDEASQTTTTEPPLPKGPEMHVEPPSSPPVPLGQGTPTPLPRQIAEQPQIKTAGYTGPSPSTFRPEPSPVFFASSNNTEETFTQQLSNPYASSTSPALFGLPASKSDPFSKRPAASTATHMADADAAFGFADNDLLVNEQVRFTFGQSPERRSGSNRNNNNNSNASDNNNVFGLPQQGQPSVVSPDVTMPGALSFPTQTSQYPEPPTELSQQHHHPLGDPGAISSASSHEVSSGQHGHEAGFGFGEHDHQHRASALSTLASVTDHLGPAQDRMVAWPITAPGLQAEHAHSYAAAGLPPQPPAPQSMDADTGGDFEEQQADGLPLDETATALPREVDNYGTYNVRRYQNEAEEGMVGMVEEDADEDNEDEEDEVEDDATRELEEEQQQEEEEEGEEGEEEDQEGEEEDEAGDDYDMRNYEDVDDDVEGNEEPGQNVPAPVLFNGPGESDQEDAFADADPDDDDAEGEDEEDEGGPSYGSEGHGRGPTGTEEFDGEEENEYSDEDGLDGEVDEDDEDEGDEDEEGDGDEDDAAGDRSVLQHFQQGYRRPQMYQPAPQQRQEAVVIDLLSDSDDEDAAPPPQQQTGQPTTHAHAPPPAVQGGSLRPTAPSSPPDEESTVSTEEATDEEIEEEEEGGEGEEGEEGVEGLFEEDVDETKNEEEKEEEEEEKEEEEEEEEREEEGEEEEEGEGVEEERQQWGTIRTQEAAAAAEGAGEDAGASAVEAEEDAPAKGQDSVDHEVADTTANEAEAVSDAGDAEAADTAQPVDAVAPAGQEIQQQSGTEGHPREELVVELVAGPAAEAEQATAQIEEKGVGEAEEEAEQQQENEEAETAEAEVGPGAKSGPDTALGQPACLPVEVTEPHKQEMKEEAPAEPAPEADEAVNEPEAVPQQAAAGSKETTSPEPATQDTSTDVEMADGHGRDEGGEVLERPTIAFSEATGPAPATAASPPAIMSTRRQTAGSSTEGASHDEDQSVQTPTTPRKEDGAHQERTPASQDTEHGSLAETSIDAQVQSQVLSEMAMSFELGVDRSMAGRHAHEDLGMHSAAVVAQQQTQPDVSMEDRQALSSTQDDYGDGDAMEVDDEVADIDMQSVASEHTTAVAGPGDGLAAEAEGGERGAGGDDADQAASHKEQTQEGRPAVDEGAASAAAAAAAAAAVVENERKKSLRSRHNRSTRRSASPLPDTRAAEGGDADGTNREENGKTPAKGRAPTMPTDMDVSVLLARGTPTTARRSKRLQPGEGDAPATSNGSDHASKRAKTDVPPPPRPPQTRRSVAAAAAAMAAAETRDPTADGSDTSDDADEQDADVSVLLARSATKSTSRGGARQGGKPQRREKMAKTASQDDGDDETATTPLLPPVTSPVPVPGTLADVLRALDGGRAAVPECVPLRSLRQHLQRRPTSSLSSSSSGLSASPSSQGGPVASSPWVDVVVVAAVASPPPQRTKTRQFALTFTVTDPSLVQQRTAGAAAAAAAAASPPTAPSPDAVVEVHLFRAHKDTLPVFQSGDGLLLRRFQVVALAGRAFGLVSTDESAYAVFSAAAAAGGHGAPSTADGDKAPEAAARTVAIHATAPQVNGPPVEDMEMEVRYIRLLMQWYRLLGDGARAQVAAANERYAAVDAAQQAPAAEPRAAGSE